MSMNNRYNHQGGFVTAYGPKLEVGVDASQDDENPGAIQEYKEECDINNIIRDMTVTGTTEWLNSIAGTYEDVTGVDFQSAMDTCIRAQEAFDGLPSSLRDRFSNSPARFLDFLADPANNEESVKLGLRNPPPPPPVQTPPVAA